jgi:hypothetical protein
MTSTALNVAPSLSSTFPSNATTAPSSRKISKQPRCEAPPQFARNWAEVGSDTMKTLSRTGTSNCIFTRPMTSPDDSRSGPIRISARSSELKSQVWRRTSIASAIVRRELRSSSNSRWNSDMLCFPSIGYRYDVGSCNPALNPRLSTRQKRLAHTAAVLGAISLVPPGLPPGELTLHWPKPAPPGFGPCSQRGAESLTKQRRR